MEEENGKVEDTKQEASFNMAVKYLERLHTLLICANEFSAENDNELWFNCLMCLYREISPKLSEDELKQYKPMITIINACLNNVRAAQSRPLPYGTVVNYPPALWPNLNSFDMLIRKHLDAHGLLMPTKEAIDDIMKKM